MIPNASVTCSRLIARQRCGTKTEDLDLETIQAMPEVRDTLRKRLDVTMEHGGTAESTFSIAAEGRGEYLDMPRTTIERIKVPATERISKQAIQRRTLLWVLVLILEGLLVSAVPVVAAWAIGHSFEPWYLALGVLPLGIPALELRRRELAEARRQDKERTQGELEAERVDKHLRSVVAEEDIAVQNALTHCVIVDGLFRRVVLSIVFWVLGQRVRMVDSLAGSLGGITSIHFGRWISTTRASLRAASFSVRLLRQLGELPRRIRRSRVEGALCSVEQHRATFLRRNYSSGEGASERELKFKAWTRDNQVNTPVYDSAYPQQTLRNMENNLRIVRGAASEPAPPRDPGLGRIALKARHEPHRI